MRDIASRPRARIELQVPTIKIPNEPSRPSEEGRSAVAPLPQDHSKHISDRAFLDDNAAVHVGLAELHLRIEEDPALGCMAVEAMATDFPLPSPSAKLVPLAVVIRSVAAQMELCSTARSNRSIGPHFVYVYGGRLATSPT